MVEEFSLEFIIETPKNGRIKYIWDEVRHRIRFKKCMPAGFIFPFSFGMVPGTLADDGDPLDVLLLMDAPVACGVTMEVTVIAALKARQKKTEWQRNDRLIAIESTCPVFGTYRSLSDISYKLQRDIESFFEAYNKVQGKEFQSMGWVDGNEAMRLIEKARKP